MSRRRHLRGQVLRKPVGELGAVDRRHDAADDRDAQRTADLASGVVDRRPDPGALRGSEPMIDSVAGSRRQAQSGTEQHHGEAEPRVPAGRVIVAASSETRRERHHPGDDDTLGTEMLASFGENGAISIIAPANGRVRSPAANGEYPSTNCRYCVERNTNPNSAKNTNMMVALAAVNRGVAEEADVEHRVVDTALPLREGGEGEGRDGEQARDRAGWSSRGSVLR